MGKCVCSVYVFMLFVVTSLFIVLVCSVAELLFRRECLCALKFNCWFRCFGHTFKHLYPNCFHLVTYFLFVKCFGLWLTHPMKAESNFVKTQQPQEIKKETNSIEGNRWHENTPQKWKFLSGKIATPLAKTEVCPSKTPGFWVSLEVLGSGHLGLNFKLLQFGFTFLFLRFLRLFLICCSDMHWIQWSLG